MPIKNTVFLGKVLLHFDHLPSTNAYAQELLSKSRPTEGTVILANYQSAGKGQFGTIWEAKPGENLTFSLLLRPVFLPIARQFALSQAIALAIRDYLATLCNETVCVKWPNDIYIGPKKVCGILIQNTLSGKIIQDSIIGVGLNVNQQYFPEGLERASSLALVTGQQYNLQSTLSGLLQHIEQRYQQLRNDQLTLIHEDYLKNLWLYQTEAWYRQPNGECFLGKIVDIQPSGLLGVQQNGRKSYYNLKEIQWVKMA